MNALNMCETLEAYLNTLDSVERIEFLINKRLLRMQDISLIVKALGGSVRTALANLRAYQPKEDS